MKNWVDCSLMIFEIDPSHASPNIRKSLKAEITYSDRTVYPIFEDHKLQDQVLHGSAYTKEKIDPINWNEFGF